MPQKEDKKEAECLHQLMCVSLLQHDHLKLLKAVGNLSQL